MIETLLIAISLSMDAFAVSLSAAACTKNLKPFHMVRAAAAFGFFQFMMPLAGWLLGDAFSALICTFDHWVAFALLSIVGGKMLLEVFEEWKQNPGDECPTDDGSKRDLTSKRVVLVLAVATSIDALAVGISFSAIGAPALVPSLVIGGVTFILCALAFLFGKRIGFVFGRYAQTVGGLVLLGIGGRILLSHLFSGS